MYRLVVKHTIFFRTDLDRSTLCTLLLNHQRIEVFKAYSSAFLPTEHLGDRPTSPDILKVLFESQRKMYGSHTGSRYTPVLYILDERLAGKN